MPEYHLAQAALHLQECSYRFGSSAGDGLLPSKVQAHSCCTSNTVAACTHKRSKGKADGDNMLIQNWFS
jgi:hypothetical protein